jgi:hypothetical protein
MISTYYHGVLFSLLRWGMDDPIWSPTTFSKNRDRLLRSDIAAAFFDAVLDQARPPICCPMEHFTVGTGRCSSRGRA